MGQLFLEKALQEPSLQVSISFSGSDWSEALSVSGVLNAESVSFNTGARYSPSLPEESAQDLIGKLIPAVPKFGPPGLKFAQQTVMAWEASDQPNFSVPMIISAVNSWDNPLATTTALVRRCLPDAWPGGLLGPPSGYIGVLGAAIKTATETASDSATASAAGEAVSGGGGVKQSIESVVDGLQQDTSSVVSKLRIAEIDKQVKGTCTVSIGGWFTAPYQLLTNASFTVSRTLTKMGYPLYCEGTISFRPYRMITEAEFGQYFSY